MSKVSIILPSREEPFLQRTITDLLAKASGDVEIIAVLDGWNTPLTHDDRVRTIRWPVVRGLRSAINAGMSIATGDYVMKIDAHCAVSPGYDVTLAADCDEDWIVVPGKYSLNVDEWTPMKDPWFYYYLTFPWDPAINHIGLQDKNYGRDWNRRFKDRTTDDIITFQGSCWFMSKAHWDRRIAPMDAEHYYYAQEPQEIGLRTWLGGGRCIVNKNVWYAHLWKGTGHKRGFPRFKHPWVRAHEYGADYWMHDRWAGRAHDMRWLVERFWDVLKANGQLGGWPDDWDDPKYEEARKRELVHA